MQSIPFFSFRDGSFDLRSAALTAGAWAGLGVAVLVLYGGIVDGWWAFDDPQILKTAFLHAPWEYFFEPHVLRSFQPANLNPWIIFSFDLDLKFFGFDPKWFYVHQLFVVWLIAGLGYHLLRPWAGSFMAAGSSLFFITSAPLYNSIHQLMTRHYLEGLLFSICAFLCYHNSIRKSQFSLACAGAFFYFLGCSAKEIYVVLPLAFLGMPIGSWRKRIYFLSPFFCVLVVYALWRRYMLGVWVGGYGQSIDWGVFFDGISAVPLIIFGDSFLRKSVAAFSAIIIISAIWRNVSFWVLAAVSTILLVGPVLPVVGISDPRRLLIFFTWSYGSAIALSLNHIQLSRDRYKWVNVLCMAVIVCFTLSHAIAKGSGIKNVGRGYEACGRFVMEGSKEDILLPPPEYGNWYTSGLAWLRVNVLQDEPPKVVYDEIILQGVRKFHGDIFRFHFSAGELRKIDGGVCHVLTEWKKRVRKEPVYVKMNYNEGVISWDFGPYEFGHYSIITYGKSGTRMNLPRYGSRRKFLSEPMVFRVRYDAPEGWISYSGLYCFDGKSLVSLTDVGRKRM